jgi:hypothetical protein
MLGLCIPNIEMDGGGAGGGAALIFSFHLRYSTLLIGFAVWKVNFLLFL